MVEHSPQTLASEEKVATTCAILITFLVHCLPFVSTVWVVEGGGGERVAGLRENSAENLFKSFSAGCRC